MMSSRQVRKLVVTALSLLSLPATLLAQTQSVITGKVTDASGNPIPGANVVIPSLGIGVGANTTVEGTYTVALPGSAAGRSVVVTARRIGFTPVSRTLTLSAGSQTQDFQLTQDVARIEDVVVTGVAEATSTKNLTISVGKVGEAQLKDVPATSPISALAGKVAGVRVSFTQGRPGSSPAIRVRTSTNLAVGASGFVNGTQGPLVLVDGVISKNGLADLNGNDIESIEVLKGAASANTYGSDAANGVVSVTTKRGKDSPEGKVSFLTRNEIGTSSVEHYVPLLEHHPFELNPDGTFVITSGGQRVIKDDRYIDADYPAGTYRNQLKENLRDGRTTTNYAQISTRRGATSFSTSFSRDADRGILPLLDGFRRQNLRLNLDQGLGAKADMSLAMTYGLSNNDQTPATNLGSGSTFFTLLQSPPDVDLTYPNGPGTTKYSPVIPADAAGGSARGNPLYDLANRSYSDRRQRIIGSFTGRVRPFTWLSLDGTYGTDRLDQRISNFFDRGLLTGNSQVETPGTGSLSINTLNQVASNSQANATTNFTFGKLHSTTRLTYLYEEERNNAFGIGFSKLTIGSVPDVQAADQTSITGVGDGNANGSTIQQIRTMNGFVTQNFNYDDRYLFQVLGRRDGSSLFGADNRWKNFYGLSGAWRVSQDFHIPGFQELKLRAAKGTAGLRPGYEYQYETYAVVSGGLSKNTIGNKDLQPAVQTETEFGINASFLDRFDVEYVKSDRHTDGAFLLVPLSIGQAGGFLGQWQNAARVGGRTFEGTLNARVIEKPNLSYNFTLTAERSRQKIDDLNRAPFRVGSNSQNQNIFYYKAGETMGVIYGKRWAKTIAELGDNPLNAGKDLNSLYEINDEGYAVAKGSRGTAEERPIPYVDPTGSTNVKIADVNPDYSYGMANTVRVGGFTFYGLLDGTKGGSIYNFTKQWMFQDMRHAALDQTGKAEENKKAIDYYQVGLYNNNEPNSYFVEDGSYLKLREASVSYALPTSVLSSLRFLGAGRTVKLAVIGRNLKTWTKYSGFDPESSSNGDFNYRIDGFRYPSYRQFTGMIEVGF
jgi:TonB-linked SusC/RagA family outer membrane protein